MLGAAGSGLAAPGKAAYQGIQTAVEAFPHRDPVVDERMPGRHDHGNATINPAAARTRRQIAYRAHYTGRGAVW